MSYTAMDLVAAAKQTIAVCDVKAAESSLSDNIILDVREPTEFAAGCLPGAINIPRGVLEFKIGDHPSFQNKQGHKIMVYCLTGGRSALATEALYKLGYTQATSMEGGFNAWKEHDFNIVQP